MSSFFRTVTDISESSGREESSAPSNSDSSSQVYSSSFGSQSQAVALRDSPSGNFEQNVLVHALLEERCINEVISELNAASRNGKHFTKHDAIVQTRAAARYEILCRQLSQHGLINSGPEHPNHQPLRQRYQDGLSLLSQTARTQDGNASSRAANGDLELAFNNLAIAGPINDQGATSRPQFLSGYQLSDTLMPSHPLLDSTRYVRDFEETTMLGKGGYGSVFRVQHRLDGLSYAVKKIPIGPTILKQIQRKGQSELDAILIELRTMARMEHPNIVRYYGGWIEWSTPRDQRSPPTREPRLLDGPDIVFANSSGGGRLSSQDSGEPSFSADGGVNGASLSKDEGFIFEDSSSQGLLSGSSPASLGSDLPQVERIRSRNTLASVVDEDDIEVIARDVTASGFDPSFSDTQQEMPTASAPSLTLHIQMSLYHMTLSDYISTNTSPAHGCAVTWRHCYHLHGSIQIILAIMEGVEYLHSEGIVHRDLKPGNIFLATRLSPSSRPRPPGTIDPFACTGCRAITSTPDTPVALHICIGDFGLVSAIKADQPPDSSTEAPSPQSQPLTRAVGTELYRPERTTERDHPSLDIYSLGIILFELLWRFDTRMERSDILGRLRKHGEFPMGFPTQPQELILEMMDAHKGVQLSCSAIRARLLDMVEQDV